MEKLRNNSIKSTKIRNIEKCYRFLPYQNSSLSFIQPPDHSLKEAKGKDYEVLSDTSN